jgi:hypothetical protein
LIPEKNSSALFASSFFPTQKARKLRVRDVVGGENIGSAAGNLLLNVMDFIIHSKQTYLFDLYYDDNCSVLLSLGKQALNSKGKRVYLR